ncbi:MAG: FMN-binding protein, partial [Candidatus Omnitrophota bacterium]
GISASLLTAINLCTRERIALNKEIKLKRSVLNVFDIAYKAEVISDVFSERIQQKRIKERIVYLYNDKIRLSGLAFEVNGPGFWGPISFLVALNPRLDIVQGIQILHQEETPGLGGRIAEDEFKEQFKGRRTRPEITVDAITGATMTSKAFKKIINDGVKLFREEYEGR